ncbi:Bgt-50972 [Blumeria graminis f. sp. tritici]|uniref:Bgt-50972 n=1 Tax=Blumeria graminis f. sp. tritici TaxID=62690 RepID=A0A9X9L9R4_BLUGR|nr:Bgt-50972 [Blumeria graminis f. sp. tritici]
MFSSSIRHGPNRLLAFGRAIKSMRLPR